VDDVEGARMPLPGHDGANPAGVTPTSDHAQVAGVELDEPLLQDGLDLLSAQSVLQTVPDELLTF